MRVPSFFGVFLLGVAALVATACSKSPGERLAETALSAASGHQVEVDKDGGKVTFKGDKGDMTIASGNAATLPADFPKDVYLPARYKVESSMQMPGATVVSVAAPGQVSALFADASKQMQAQGWKQTMAMQQSGQTQMLAFEKADRSAMVSFDAGDDGDVKVALQLATKQ
jgi:hypothetical protein